MLNLHVQTNVMLLKDRLHMNIYKLAHKIVYSYDGLIKAGNLQQAPRNTRAFDRPTLNCITPKNNKYRLSLDYTLRSKWNALPADIRNISDYNMFKTRIKYFYNSMV